MGARGNIPVWDTEMAELSPGAFAYIQRGGGFCVSNAGLLSGRDRSVAVDALFTPKMTRTFLGEAARATASPIETLINTHHHVDHTLGNHAFAGRAIIGHALTRAEMRRVGDPTDRIVATAPHFKEDLAQPVAIVPPNVTYEDTMTLWVDEREVRLIHVPTAHTIDDTLVYLPVESILYAGDICFFYVTPLAFEGSITGWIDALRTVEEMAPDRIVPGHGPVGTLADVARLRGYFEGLRDQARRHFDAGTPAERAIFEIDLGPYETWPEPERIVPNVLRLYQDFGGGPWGPIDLAASAVLQRDWLAARG